MRSTEGTTKDQKITELVGRHYVNVSEVSIERPKKVVQLNDFCRMFLKSVKLQSYDDGKFLWLPYSILQKRFSSYYCEVYKLNSISDYDKNFSKFWKLLIESCVKVKVFFSDLEAYETLVVVAHLV